MPLIRVDSDVADGYLRLLERGYQGNLFLGVVADVGIDREDHVALMPARRKSSSKFETPASPSRSDVCQACINRR